MICHLAIVGQTQKLYAYLLDCLRMHYVCWVSLVHAMAGFYCAVQVSPGLCIAAVRALHAYLKAASVSQAAWHSAQTLQKFITLVRPSFPRSWTLNLASSR